MVAESSLEYFWFLAGLGVSAICVTIVWAIVTLTNKTKDMMSNETD